MTNTLTPAEMADGAYIGTVVMYSEGPAGRTVYVSEARTGRVVAVHLHSGDSARPVRLDDTVLLDVSKHDGHTYIDLDVLVWGTHAYINRGGHT